MRHGPHETPRIGQSVVSRYVRTPKPCSCRDQCAPVVPIRHATANDKPEANQPILRLLLHVGLLPGAETAARAKRARARLARLKVRARLPRCPARSRRLRCYEAHAAPHAHRPTQAHAPRPAHARRSWRCSRPSRAPCSRWQMGAQGRWASRRTVGQRQCVSSLSTVYVRLGASEASSV